jgi:hypothetical protein
MQRLQRAAEQRAAEAAAAPVADANADADADADAGLRQADKLEPVAPSELAKRVIDEDFDPALVDEADLVDAAS